MFFHAETFTARVDACEENKHVLGHATRGLKKRNTRHSPFALAALSTVTSAVVEFRKNMIQSWRQSSLVNSARDQNAMIDSSLAGEVCSYDLERVNDFTAGKCLPRGKLNHKCVNWNLHASLLFHFDSLRGAETETLVSNLSRRANFSTMERQPAAGGSE